MFGSSVPLIMKYSAGPNSFIRGDTVSINTLDEVRSSFVTVKVVPLGFVIVIVNVAFDSMGLSETSTSTRSSLSVAPASILSMVVPVTLTLLVSIVLFTFKIKYSKSPTFAYEVLLLLLSMVNVSMPIGGVSFTITFRVMIGPGLPASSSGAV